MPVSAGVGQSFKKPTSIMSDQTTDLPASKAQFFKLPLDLIEYILSLHLTGTQHDLLLLLWKLDPYGDRFIDIPNPQELAILLKVNVRTVERAAQRLADCRLFEFQIEHWKARNCKGFSNLVLPDEHFDCGKTLEPSQSNGSGHFTDVFLSAKRSKFRQKDPNFQNGISLPREKNGRSPEPLQNGHSKNEPCTNNKEQTLLETTEQSFVFPSINREKIGTTELLELITNAGVQLNKTIIRLIEQLHQSDPDPEAVVRNALSSLKEEQQKGRVKNPGVFLWRQ